MGAVRARDEDATTIRRRILLAFERAECETAPQRRAALLTFVIIGAGPTGVELAHRGTGPGHAAAWLPPCRKFGASSSLLMKRNFSAPFGASRIVKAGEVLPQALTPTMRSVH